MEALHRMGIRLSHRGTVVHEEAVSAGVTLGERLHTISPSLRTATLALVADADLYNAEELRPTLEKQGQQFETARPEEVILRGYLEFGPSVCEYLHGDYAFALWDAAQSLLLLARDPLGVRPLYYWMGQGRLAFASEYKALLALAYIPVQPDMEAIQILQHSKFPPANRTLLRDIVCVPAGHYLVYRDGRSRQQRYWSIAIHIEPHSEEEHVNATHDQFLRAVRRRVQDLAVVGTTLSGGIDSAAVSAAVRAVKPDAALHTFTCGYGLDDPEMRSAEMVARAIGSTHHPIVVKPDAIPPLLAPLVWHLEDPIARSETVQIYETARVAAQFVPVVLAGYAADGLYAGMPKHKLIRFIEQFPPLTIPILEFYDYTQTSVAPSSLVGKLLHYAYYRGKDAPPPSVAGAPPLRVTSSLPNRREELLNQMLKTGVMEGVPKWLPKADRLHMAHGLRFRSPFTDLDLIHSAFAISGRWKIRGLREKYVLRKAMRALLPDEVMNRPKFPQAMNYDLAFSDMIDALSQEVLSDAAIRARGFFDTTEIDRLRRRPAGSAYSAERAMRLWTAALTEIWAQIFIDGRGVRTTYQKSEMWVESVR
jgi:asparagine synthase (glutamine-hydrolysing)